MGIDRGSLDVLNFSLGFSSFFLLRFNLFGLDWSSGVLSNISCCILGRISHGFSLRRWLVDNFSTFLIFLVLYANSICAFLNNTNTIGAVTCRINSGILIRLVFLNKFGLRLFLLLGNLLVMCFNLFCSSELIFNILHMLILMIHTTLHGGNIIHRVDSKRWLSTDEHGSHFDNSLMDRSFPHKADASWLGHFWLSMCNNKEWEFRTLFLLDLYGLSRRVSQCQNREFAEHVLICKNNNNLF